MDRNTVIGFVMIALILITFAIFNSPKKDLQTPAPVTLMDTSTKSVNKSADSLALNKKDTTNIDTVSAQNKNTSNVPVDFLPLTKGDTNLITFENELLIVKINPKGGQIGYIELKKYKTFDKKPLILTNPQSSTFGYEFPYKNQIIKTNDLFYSLKEKNVKSADSQTISMVLKINDYTYIEHVYTIYKNNYMIGMDIKMIGFDSIIPKNQSYIDLTWDQNAIRQEKSLDNERSASTIYYRYQNDDPASLSLRKDAKEDLNGKIKWVSYTQHFFNQTIISRDPFIRGAIATTTDQASSYIKNFHATLSFPYKHQKDESYHLSMYMGPNHYKTLKKYNEDLQKIIPLGWGIFGWVNKWLVIPVFAFLSRFISNFGIIILILTIFIKVILLPLTYKSYLSTAKMKLLKPELDELKAKVGKDMAKLQTEQMKLYKKAGVSPLGGCLPMLLQMPILIAMFRFFPSSIELRQQAFLWAKDLSSYDSIWNFPNGFSIPFYGDHVSLFTLLMTVSTIIYTKMNNDMMGTGDTQKQMKIISYVMPIMFLGFFNSYSAALSYYYFLANILTFGQQYLFKIAINEDKLRAKIEANKLRKGDVKKSNWQIKLENMQHKQQQQRKTIGKGK
jgi:YidC/Oxa1 family membrane protein insertase